MLVRTFYFYKLVDKALGFEPRRPSGKLWTCRQVLGIAKKRRLSKHETYAAESQTSTKGKMVDLGQTTKFTSVSRKVSCLTKMCFPFSFDDERIMWGLEKLQVQGIPIWYQSPTCFSAIGDLARSGAFGSNDADKLAGNSMAARAIGWVLLFALSSVKNNY